MFDIQEELKKLPDLPGVYLMKNSEGEVIYVGKAISLKSRVRSYFNKDASKHPKVIAMVSHIHSFSYLIVDNEVEALVLESNLIKEKRPKYNILLRDDKSYPFIKITKEPYPRLQKTRRVLNDGGTYFGPFPNAFAVNELIDLIHEIYPLRTCNLDFRKGARLKRPCLNYFIGRCLAPCVGKADEALYLKNIEVIEAFLKGKSDHLIHYLRSRMEGHSEKQEYEMAIKYRDYLNTVDIVLQKQKISNLKGQDIDMISVVKEDQIVCFQIFYMRGGRVIDAHHFITEDEYDSEYAELMSAFIKQYYLDVSYIPREVLVEYEPIDLDSIREFLRQKKGSLVHIQIPKRGEKVDLLKMVRQNALENLNKYKESKKRRERIRPLGLEHLEGALGLEGLHRIEAYDISNTSGVQSVGSMVVFEEGIKETKEYRKFKIKSIEGSDDYGSMREVLQRRFRRWEVEKHTGTGFGSTPDILLIDGGIGHVHTAQEVLDAFQLEIPVCGLVKDEFHNTRALIYQDREYPLKLGSAVYRFLYGIQEEAHRFAIDYHKKLRSKSLTGSVLDEIPGIGPMRRQSLLRHFQSVEGIRRASVEELMNAPKMNRRAAESVHHYLNEDVR